MKTLASLGKTVLIHSGTSLSSVLTLSLLYSALVYNLLRDPISSSTQDAPFFTSNVMSKSYLTSVVPFGAGPAEECVFSKVHHVLESSRTENAGGEWRG